MDFEKFLKNCKPYTHNDTIAYFWDEYSTQGSFSDSQWKKLCVKENKKDKDGIFYKHRIFYKNIFDNELRDKILTIIMFNPSTANHHSKDPTIRNCIQIAKDNNYGGIEIINMLTIRNPDINSAIEDCENKILPFSAYLNYLKNKKDILIAWGGTNSLNKKNKIKKSTLHNEFLTELKNKKVNLYTYSIELVDNYFPRHPSPQSFNKALKDNKVEKVDNKIKLQHFTYEK